MTWSSPATGKTFFETNDIPTQGNFSTYIFDNLLAIAHPYDYSPADLDVANSSSETVLYSKTVTGGDMGSNGLLHLILEGDYVKNNAAADRVNIRVKFGGATHLSGSLSPNFSDAVTVSGRASWRVALLLSNRGATNSQWLRAVYEGVTAGNISGATDSATWGWAVGTQFTAQQTSSFAAPTIDTTADQTLQVSAQWSAASANNSFRKRFAVLTLAQN